MELVEVKQEEDFHTSSSPPSLVQDDFHTSQQQRLYDDFNFNSHEDDEYSSSISLPPFPSFNHQFEVEEPIIHPAYYQEPYGTDQMMMMMMSGTNILQSSSSSSSSSSNSHIVNNDHHDPETRLIWNELERTQPPKSRAPNYGHVITREMLSRYFYMPITEAAKELNVGLTLLKKRCRELGVGRWPHRKLMSLNTLISNVQRQAADADAEEGIRLGKLEEAIRVLENERKVLEECPDLQLESNTKRLRQACFKANYKRKRKHSLMMMNDDDGSVSRRGRRKVLIRSDVQDTSVAAAAATTTSGYEDDDDDDDGDEEIRSLLFQGEFDFAF